MQDILQVILSKGHGKHEQDSRFDEINGNQTATTHESENELEFRRTIVE